MTKEEKFELIAEDANIFQARFYCIYCRKRVPLKYIWDNSGRLFGIGLEQWFYCSQCKRKYKRGIWGFTEQELDTPVKE
jgi:hypothetical protein